MVELLTRLQKGEFCGGPVARRSHKSKTNKQQQKTHACTKRGQDQVWACPDHQQCRDVMVSRARALAGVDLALSGTSMASVGAEASQSVTLLTRG